MASKQVPALNFTGNWTRWKELIVGDERDEPTETSRNERDKPIRRDEPKRVETSRDDPMTETSR